MGRPKKAGTPAPAEDAGGDGGGATSKGEAEVMKAQGVALKAALANDGQLHGADFDLLFPGWQEYVPEVTVRAGTPPLHL
jgi:hypothetical protein